MLDKWPRVSVYVLAIGVLSGLYTPVAQACTLPTELPPEALYIGLAVAQADAAGRWGGRWLGAHPVRCQDGAYVVSLPGEAWAALQRVLELPDAGARPLLFGDLPYLGDGVCAVGATRRWWGEGELVTAALSRWRPAPVPSGLPPVPCPQNLPADAPLVLQAEAAAP
jgi:hypothetical protein